MKTAKREQEVGASAEMRFPQEDRRKQLVDRSAEARPAKKKVNREESSQKPTVSALAKLWVAEISFNRDFRQRVEEDIAALKNVSTALREESIKEKEKEEEDKQRYRTLLRETIEKNTEIVNKNTELVREVMDRVSRAEHKITAAETARVETEKELASTTAKLVRTVEESASNTARLREEVMNLFTAQLPDMRVRLARHEQQITQNKEDIDFALKAAETKDAEIIKAAEVRDAEIVKLTKDSIVLKRDRAIIVGAATLLMAAGLPAAVKIIVNSVENALGGHTVQMEKVMTKLAEIEKRAATDPASLRDTMPEKRYEGGVRTSPADERSPREVLPEPLPHFLGRASDKTDKAGDSAVDSAVDSTVDSTRDRVGSKKPASESGTVENLAK